MNPIKVEIRPKLMAAAGAVRLCRGRGVWAEMGGGCAEFAEFAEFAGMRVDSASRHWQPLFAFHFSAAPRTL